jgi:anti-sigma B factor antagonist
LLTGTPPGIPANPVPATTPRHKLRNDDSSLRAWSDPMTDAFCVSVDRAGGTVPVVAVFGEIDMLVGPRLKDCLIELARGAPKAIVVDMSEVSFMDSTGLLVLSSTRTQLNRSGGQLILSGLQPQVLRVLDVSGMTDMFSIASTRAQALADAGVLHVAPE